MSIYLLAAAGAGIIVAEPRCDTLEMIGMRAGKGRNPRILVYSLVADWALRHLVT